MVYAVALAAVLGMSSACLAATRSGYFKYSAKDVPLEDQDLLKYEVRVNRYYMSKSCWGRDEVVCRQDVYAL